MEAFTNMAKCFKTLPKLEEAATSVQLKDAFHNHWEKTQLHVTRLENVFSLIREEADAIKCHAMAE
jgi:ferritin-like metal-binding protein YciE